MASFFLGLEVLSVALYALIGYERANSLGVEAALKYLVLAAASAAFLLFGMSLLYAESGDLGFAGIAKAYAAHSAVVLPAGLALLVVGIGFKLAVVPFHLWTPDVYQGAPAPVTALIATVSKGAMFALLLRLFRQLAPEPNSPAMFVFVMIAIASMFAGNLLALLQDNVKRMLAYSSIAHLGYLLVAFLAAGPLRDQAVAYYLTAYFVTTLGAFGVVTILSGTERDADRLADYRGLAWRRPWAALVMTAMLLSLAGIPLTAGFIGKFYVIAAGAASQMWMLLVILVINSAIGLFYYLRVVATMFMPAGALAVTKPPMPLAAFALAVLTLLLVLFGIAPSLLLRDCGSGGDALTPRRNLFTRSEIIAELRYLAHGRLPLLIAAARGKK